MRLATPVIVTMVAAAFLSTPAAAATDGRLWWPVDGKVTSQCGVVRADNKTHAGIDIARNPVTDVHAAYDGTVRWETVGRDVNGYGNYFDIVHGNGYATRYAHLLEGPLSGSPKPLVANGARVSRGQLIAHTGLTGRVRGGRHLHFEILKDGRNQCSANVALDTPITSRKPTTVTIGATSGGDTVVNGGGVRITGPNSYTDVSRTGQVYAYNGRYLGGSPAGYSGRFTDAKVTSDGNGYWLLTSAGQIYAYGNAPYRGGSPSGFSGDIVAMAATRDNQGYVMVSATGQVYAYNTAYRGGSPTGYSGRFVDVEMTPNGGGYWLLTSAGQIYAYGNAAYLGGSPAGFDRAIVAMSPTTDGAGYVMVSKAGQIYAYGNARYMGGSPAGVTGEIADVSYRTDGQPGYLMVSTAGQHYAYNTPWLGNPTGASGF